MLYKSLASYYTTDYLHSCYIKVLPVITLPKKQTHTLSSLILCLYSCNCILLLPPQRNPCWHSLLKRGIFSKGSDVLKRGRQSFWTSGILFSTLFPFCFFQPLFYLRFLRSRHVSFCWSRINIEAHIPSGSGRYSEGLTFSSEKRSRGSFSGVFSFHSLFFCCYNLFPFPPSSVCGKFCIPLLTRRDR